MLNRKIIHTIFLSISALLIHFSGSCQEWATVKFDTNLTVKMPVNYEIKDTNDVKVISGSIESCLTIISRSFVNDTSFTKNKDLVIYFYKIYERKYIKRLHGHLINSETVTINNLLWRKFSFYQKLKRGKCIHHCLVLLFNQSTYSISFVELESNSEKVKMIREKYFSGIIVSSNN